MHINFSMERKYFHENYLYKKPFIFKKALDVSCISWKEINELYQRADPTDWQFKFRKGEIIPKEAYVESFNDVGRIRHRFNKTAVYQYLQDGATMVYNRIDNEPFVDTIAKQVAQFAQAQTVVSGYLAFGSSSSYRNHWDTRDVFAVQLIGKKHWTISAPNFDMPLYMQQAKDMPHITPSKTVDMEVILEAGDILYIPRGWWHNPMPMNCETFHLAIGTFPPNGYNYMEWLMKKIPDIQSIRQNFIGWEHDQKNLDDSAQAVTEMMNNPKNYQAFMQDFLGNQRTNTAFNMDLFGNAHNQTLPEHCFLRLNSNDCSTLPQGFLIVNGIKLNVDESSMKFLTILVDKYMISLAEILLFFSVDEEENIKKLVWRLGELDIIEIIR
ncbi:TPA: cupin domain-containing protein [Neisseria meningitidis]|uniref:Cupin domain-containing protein n=7 Tax=Neisseria meningitidis TaxID=487 RepID=A0AB37K4K3_NEIME|nr:cupin domain-containing protein [Neisseria meningitidis]CBA09627.1 myc induced nuclear antigen [Neisseria meningitidis alpha275]MBG9011323.1 cupin domain-containing protein [Neisseria meningitidis]MBG9065697.1 cupin domain-containing protein [Neisseria meningitidis]MBG9077677.1 cupin domain-containing protein [Neisseria meningitidis]MBG9094112.1 cupin domain-containing protein [Neisseria meningitidis]